MKKLSVLGLILLLSSCGFQSKEEFLKDQSLKEEDDKPVEIEYVKEGNNKESLDFESIYGKGQKSQRVPLKDAIGNLVTTRLAGEEIGISIKPSAYLYNSYPAVLSYEENDQIIEKEYGPVAAGDNIFAQVNFDIIKSESGPMVLVSQIVIKEGENSSAYYLYNKYMSLVDSFQFINSQYDTNTQVYRLGNPVDINEQVNPGNLELAIKKRIETEAAYLDEILKAYKVDYEKVRGKVNGKEIEVGHMPKPTEGRIVEIKSLERNQDGAVLSIK